MVSISLPEPSPFRPIIFGCRISPEHSRCASTHCATGFRHVFPEQRQPELLPFLCREYPASITRRPTPRNNSDELLMAEPWLLCIYVARGESPIGNQNPSGIPSATFSPWFLLLTVVPRVSYAATVPSHSCSRALSLFSSLFFLVFAEQNGG